MFMDQDGVKVNKVTHKKNDAIISSHLDYTCMALGNFFLRDTADSSKGAR